MIVDNQDQVITQILWYLYSRVITYLVIVCTIYFGTFQRVN